MCALNFTKSGSFFVSFPVGLNLKYRTRNRAEIPAQPQTK